MGDYLLFSGYYILELEDIFLDLRVVEAEHPFLVAGSEKKRGTQGYIRDQKGGELQFLFIPSLDQLVHEPHLFLIELLEAYGLDLAYAELLALCLEDLVVAGDHGLGPPLLYTARRAEYLGAEGFVLKAGVLLAPFNYLLVPVGRSRGLEDHSIGKHASEQDSGYLLFYGDAFSPKKLRHEGRGGAHRLAYEGYGLLAGEVAYPVVVDDLHDVYLLGPFYGLGKLIMVDEDEAGRRSLYERPLGY